MRYASVARDGSTFTILIVARLTVMTWPKRRTMYSGSLSRLGWLVVLLRLSVESSVGTTICGLNANCQLLERFPIRCVRVERTFRSASSLPPKIHAFNPLHRSGLKAH